MFARWFGKALTDEEQKAMIAKVRSQCEGDGDHLSDVTLRRFCVAREWNEQAITDMVQAHLKWKKETLPVERTDAIQRVLDSGRLRILRRGKDPVLAVDFMWGKFLLDDFSEDDIISAQILQLEEVLAEADQLCPEDQPAQYIAVSSGGPPPTPFVQKITPIFDANYPERCGKAIIYPIPRWMKWVADAILVLVPKRTRDKFIMLSDEAEFCESTCLSVEELPDDLKGGIEGSRERREKAMEDSRTKDQLPQVYQDAINNPEAQTMQMMQNVSC